jgi:L-alanine-DL-glutamate epimerase-like enolase superfamily enzyme
VTVGIDDPAGMAERARTWREAGYPALKVKLGTDDDRERLRAVREAAPDASIRVDANGDWSPEAAIEALSWLADLDVALLEQPVPADDHAGLARVTEAAPMPVAADESCVTAGDVPAVADAVDVVVVKLMKCGGIRPARRQIAAARVHGLDPMLGCMVETSASIAGAAHLGPLVASADLDGALLLADDPCAGPSLADGRIDLSGVDAGTGARRR